LEVHNGLRKISRFLILLPFGSSLSALFGWFRITTLQTHLCLLLMGTLLNVYQVGLPVRTPFLPALRIDG